MKPTRAFVDAVMKYKLLYSQLDNPENHFLFDYQKEYVDFVFNGNKIPDSLLAGQVLNKFKSIECQIMDWADDTAYATNDLVDSISGGFLTLLKLEKFRDKMYSELSEEELEHIEEIISWIRKGNYKAKFGSQIGEMIQACSVVERKTFMDGVTNRYKYELLVDHKVERKVELYKKIAVVNVFRSPQLHQMEFKGDYMVKKFFGTFEDNYIKEVTGVKLLPEFTHNLLKSCKDEVKRARIVCDYIAGMTDAFAMTTYKRLFDPGFSSIKDFM